MGDGERTSNTDTDEKAPGRQHVEHADRLALPVRAGGEGGKDDEDDGGEEERVGARPVVGEEAKDELADDDAGERDAADVLLGGGLCVDFAVLAAEGGADGANDLEEVGVGIFSKTRRARDMEMEETRE